MAPKAGLIFPFPGEINRAKSLRERKRERATERVNRNVPKLLRLVECFWVFFFSCSSCLGRSLLSVTVTLSGAII